MKSINLQRLPVRVMIEDALIILWPILILLIAVLWFFWGNDFRNWALEWVWSTGVRMK